MALHNDNMGEVSKWGDPLPAGSYRVRIESATEGPSKESGNPMVTLKLVCQDEPHVGRVIMDYPSLQKGALAKLKAYYEAVDYNPGPEGHDPSTLQGKELYIYTETEMYQGTSRNKVPPYGPRHIMQGPHPTKSSTTTAAAR